MQTGYKLPNGAVVIIHDKATDIVLCEFRGEFVTWSFNPSDTSCNHGHYHNKNLLEATKEFNERRGV